MQDKNQNTVEAKDKEKDAIELIEEALFDYPKSNKRLEVKVKKYEFMSDKDALKGQTTRLSPEAIEFRSTKDYEVGTLLKISLTVPNYWDRKQQLDNYGRIDEPSELSILAKVVKSSRSGKRSRNRMVVAKTVNIADVDEKLLEEFLTKG